MRSGEKKSTDTSWDFFFFFYFIHACLWYSSTWFNRHDIRELRRRYNADNGKGDHITSDDYISTCGSIEPGTSVSVARNSDH